MDVAAATEWQTCSYVKWHCKLLERGVNVQRPLDSSAHPTSLAYTCALAMPSTSYDSPRYDT